MQLKQYEYSMNEEDNSKASEWSSGSIFGTFSATRIRIQGPPGTKFCLNGGQAYITIGYDGVYELDLSNSGGIISALQFQPLSLTNSEDVAYDTNILVELYTI